MSSSETSLPDVRSPDVTISVVINNYNYGHFLESCLASVAAQTRPPDQVVVVDDGSTDGSLDRLAGRTDLMVLSQENGGQAAAFNAGFAAATGEAILFLDADDLLRPEALDVVARFWTGDTTWLSYRLDKVDARGARVGHYEMAVPEEDLLPRMMKDLTFPFMPTSGNVFSRKTLAWAFPLPEERWRISADALLVRAALLSGPCRHVNQVLADYRVHGANNYHRDDATHTAEIQRGILHIAEAGLDLVTLADRQPGRLSRGDRARLLMASLRHRVRAERQDPDPEGFRLFLSRLKAACPAWRDARLARYVALIAPLLPRSETLQRWIAEPRERPERVQNVLDRILGRDLRESRTALAAPRSPFDGLPDADHFRRKPPTLDSLLTAPEWHRDYERGGYDLCHVRGRLQVWLPPGEACSLTLTVAPLGQGSRRVVVATDGEMVLSHWIHGEEQMQVRLPSRPPGETQPVEIEIRVPDYHTQRRRLQTHGPHLPRLKMLAAEVSVDPPAIPDLVLPVETALPFDAMSDSLRRADGAVADDAEAVGPGEWIQLSPPPLSSPFCLHLAFSERQGVGDLLVLVNGTVAFSGVVGSGAVSLVEMPPGSGAPTRTLAVSFSFRPENFLDGADLWIASMGWCPGAAHDDAPILRTGERAVAGLGRGLEPFLDGGWQPVPEEGALMSGSSAGLALAPEMAGPGRVLRLDLEPLDVFASEVPPILIVTRDGTESARVALSGRADVDLPFEAAADPSAEPIEIALHAAAVDENDVPCRDHGGIMLRGVTLVPGGETSPTIVPAEADPGHAPPLAQLLDRLRAVSQGPAQIEELQQLREALLTECERIAPAAMWHLVSADDLGNLAWLGAALPPVEADETWDGANRTWLAAAVLSLLQGRYGTALDLPLAAIPALDSKLRGVAAACLVSAAATRSDRVETRLEDARQVLASAPVGSGLWALASDVIDAFGEAGVEEGDAGPARIHRAAVQVRRLRLGHRFTEGHPLIPTEGTQQKRYLFHHIAKTGGVSLRHILADWFEIVPDYHEHWNEDVIRDPIDLACIGPDQIIAGHYKSEGNPLAQRYPEVLRSEDWRIIAFVREPLDWALSDYHFAAKNRPEFDPDFIPLALGEHLRRQPITLCDWLDCDETTWRARLDQYWFIGTLERFDECVAWLAREMGKPLPPSIPAENATVRDQEPTEEDIAAFRKKNALDYEIYDEINARLDRLIGPMKGR